MNLRRLVAVLLVVVVELSVFAYFAVTPPPTFVQRLSYVDYQPDIKVGLGLVGWRFFLENYTYTESLMHKKFGWGSCSVSQENEYSGGTLQVWMSETQENGTIVQSYIERTDDGAIIKRYWYVGVYPRGLNPYPSENFLTPDLLAAEQLVHDPFFQAAVNQPYPPSLCET